MEQSFQRKVMRMVRTACLLKKVPMIYGRVIWIMMTAYIIWLSAPAAVSWIFSLDKEEGGRHVRRSGKENLW